MPSATCFRWRQQQACQRAAAAAPRANFRSFSGRYAGSTSRFVAMSCSPARRSPIEAQITDLVGKVAAERASRTTAAQCFPAGAEAAQDTSASPAPVCSKA